MRMKNSENLLSIIENDLDEMMKSIETIFPKEIKSSGWKTKLTHIISVLKKKSKRKNVLRPTYCCEGKNLC